MCYADFKFQSLFSWIDLCVYVRVVMAGVLIVVSILVFLDRPLRGRPETRSSLSGPVSILVFLDRPLRGFYLMYGDDGDGKFQSLFSWIDLCVRCVRLLTTCIMLSFNPCFLGSTSAWGLPSSGVSRQRRSGFNPCFLGSTSACS